MMALLGKKVWYTYAIGTDIPNVKQWIPHGAIGRPECDDEVLHIDS